MPVVPQEMEESAGIYRATGFRVTNRADERRRMAIKSIPGASIVGEEVVAPQTRLADTRHPVAVILEQAKRRGDLEKSLTFFQRFLVPAREAFSLAQLELAKIRVDAQEIEIHPKYTLIQRALMPDESRPALFSVAYKAKPEHLYDAFTTIANRVGQFGAKLVDMQYVAEE